MSNRCKEDCTRWDVNITSPICALCKRTPPGLADHYTPKPEDLVFNVICKCGYTTHKENPYCANCGNSLALPHKVSLPTLEQVTSLPCPQLYEYKGFLLTSAQEKINQIIDYLAAMRGEK